LLGRSLTGNGATRPGRRARLSREVRDAIAATARSAGIDDARVNQTLTEIS
jgi:hypothetical protein